MPTFPPGANRAPATGPSDPLTIRRARHIVRVISRQTEGSTSSINDETEGSNPFGCARGRI